MKRVTASGLVLACLLLAGAATAADKKDKTYIDLKAIEKDNVVANDKHTNMSALGDRVHGGAFGPWRCQIKILDRRDMKGRIKAEAHEGAATTHFLTLSIMDPAAGKGVSSGKGTVTLTGPDKAKVKLDMQALGGLFSADINLPKPGDYAIQVDFASGKQKASAAFSYKVK